MMKIQLRKSNKVDKKWKVTFSDGYSVHFGASGYQDYTMHKDAERKQRYIQRHDRGKEDWKISGIRTAGFWSRWLLWNLPSLTVSIKDIEERFGVQIVKQ